MCGFCLFGMGEPNTNGEYDKLIAFFVFLMILFFFREHIINAHFNTYPLVCWNDYPIDVSLSAHMFIIEYGIIPFTYCYGVNVLKCNNIIDCPCLHGNCNITGGCGCESKFTGPLCSDCKFGYYPNCNGMLSD